MTAIIDESEWGLPIPHDPRPYVGADGTVVEAVCPFPAEMGLVFFDECWGPPGWLSMCVWDDGPGIVPITAYRLRADHHAYGPRKSRQDRAPDRWSNAYDCEDLIHRGADWHHRQAADYHWDEDKARAGRIGLWRIFLKRQAPSMTDQATGDSLGFLQDEGQKFDADTRPRPELIVLPDEAAARESGLLAGCQHHAGQPHVECWYPSLGLFRLSARPWQRVTIDRSVHDSTPEGSLRAILRSRQLTWGNKAVWLEIGSPPASALPTAGLERARRRDRRPVPILYDEVDRFSD